MIPRQDLHPAADVACAWVVKPATSTKAMRSIEVFIVLSEAKGCTRVLGLIELEGLSMGKGWRATI